MDRTDGNIVISESWIGRLVDFFIEHTKPLYRFVTQMMDSGWLGFALMFMLFFSLYLARKAALSGRGGVGIYAESLEYMGVRGLLVTAGYLLLFGLVWAFMPIWTVILSSLANSLTGDEPGFLQMVAFVASPTPQRKAFLNQMAAFYASGETVMPLGWRAASLLAVAFGSMLLVGKAAGRFRGSAP